MKPNWICIEQKIAESVGREVKIERRQISCGGSINQAFVLRGPECAYFVKLNHASRVDMFAAEFDGLLEIKKSNSLRVPEAHCYDVVDESSFIAMELLPIGHSDSAGMVQLGHKLAAMHQCTQKQFGWYRDNTIGSTEQVNTYMDDWGQFWQQQRLLFQLNLAAQNGFRAKLQRQGDKLAAKVADFFGHKPQASLLHGDLWSGNYSICKHGQPVIYDPALYYGDRETDLAMTELFGGFSSDFYSAYNEVYKLDVDYPIRKTLYNLYHILNHLNLFGSGYLHQAEDMIDRLLSEV